MSIHLERKHGIPGCKWIRDVVIASYFEGDNLNGNRLWYAFRKIVLDVAPRQGL
jgi:hypothetical protein